MAALVYEVDSRGKTIGTSYSVDPNGGLALFYIFLPQGIVNTLSSITASLSTKDSGTHSVHWFWSKVTSNFSSSNSFVDNRTTNMTTLKNQFNPNYPFLVARYGITNNSSSSISAKATSYSISGNGTFLPLATVSAGDTITVSQISALQTYANKISTQYNKGTSITLTNPTAGSPITNNFWQNCVNKLNATPYINNLACPGAGIKANAAYYNSIVSAMVPG